MTQATRLRGRTTAHSSCSGSATPDGVCVSWCASGRDNDPQVWDRGTSDASRCQPEHQIPPCPDECRTYKEKVRLSWNWSGEEYK